MSLVKRAEELGARPDMAARDGELRRSLGLITLAWVFGSVWLAATSGTPYTNFAKGLGASEFEFGVLAALPYLASLVSLPASLVTEATGKRKLIFLLGLYGQRLMWVPITVVPLWMVSSGGGESRGAVLVFLGLVLVMQLSGAVGGPAWTSWMADIVPVRARGRYFGNRRVWGTLSAIPSAVVVGVLLDKYAAGGAGAVTVLWWCAAILIAAAVFGMADIATFHWVPEVKREPQRGIHLLRAMRAPLHDRQFLRFGAYVATLTFAISFMGQFVTLYILEMLAKERGGTVGNTNTVTQLMVIVAPAVAQLVVFPVWGRAADRMGKRPLLILAGLGLVPVAAGWWFVTPERIWLGYVLSGLGAAFWAGIEVANLNLVLEMSASGEDGSVAGGSGYVAVNAVIINLAGCLGGIASGVIAQGLKDVGFEWVTSWKTFTYYDVLFGVSAVMRLGAVVLFTPHIRETGARPAHEALRFMTSNIYNNLVSAAVQPVRVIREVVFR